MWIPALEASPFASGVCARVQSALGGVGPQSCSSCPKDKEVADGEVGRDDLCVELLAVSFDGQRLSKQYVVYKVFHAVLKTMKQKKEDHGFEDWLKYGEVGQKLDKSYPSSFKELTSKFSFPVSAWQLTTWKETDSPCSTDSQFNPWKNLK